MQSSDLEIMVGKNENILWKGKPNKKCFILESIFNPLLPVAFLWGLFDFGFIGLTMSAGTNGMGLVLFFFFAIHLMPVWMYIGGVLLSFRKYKNTEYIITDRGIYVSGGTFSYTYEMKPFTDLSHITIHRGMIDQWLGVGDVISVCNHRGYNTYSSHEHNTHASHGLAICDISDYQKVFEMIKDLQTDIYSDTMYPNDLRPQENPGYQTQYTKKDQW